MKGRKKKKLNISLQTHLDITYLLNQVEKFGHPNGIIQFKGMALSEQMIEEPQGTGTLELRFPIVREEVTGTRGSIQVNK